MTFPNGSEYSQAVQDPSICFVDPVLRQSRAETNLFGLPIAYSGGFTTTFKLQSASGAWAVRCFKRKVNQVQERYQEIAKLIQTDTQLADYFTAAEHLQSGIRVNGVMYPVIKMKWVQGEPINLYLQKNLRNRHALESILCQFATLVHKLESAGVAHGDFQHGNFMVIADKLVLIDYDDFYFPNILGLTANSDGHPNFQHPKRSTKDYNRTLDRFPSIVIYLGIKAIIHNSSLWSKYDNSENILIKSTDIADLNHSPLMKDLKAIHELSPLVDRFKGICYLPFNQVPTLDEFLQGSFKFDPNATGRISIRLSQYKILDGRKSGAILEYFGQRVEVVGRIDSTKHGKTRNDTSYVFLEMGLYPAQTFKVVIWQEGLIQLHEKGIDITAFKNQWVSVTGVIGTYKSTPQIIVGSATGIQLLSGEDEALERISGKVPVVLSGTTDASNRPHSKGSEGPKNQGISTNSHDWFSQTGFPKASGFNPTPLRNTSQQPDEQLFNSLYQNYPVTPTTPPLPSSSSTSGTTSKVTPQVAATKPQTPTPSSIPPPQPTAPKASSHAGQSKSTVPKTKSNSPVNSKPQPKIPSTPPPSSQPSSLKTQPKPLPNSKPTTQLNQPSTSNPVHPKPTLSSTVGTISSGHTSSKPPRSLWQKILDFLIDSYAYLVCFYDRTPDRADG
jgi:hypothetical protein